MKRHKDKKNSELPHIHLIVRSGNNQVVLYLFK